jgi:hypothetical protein
VESGEDGIYDVLQAYASYMYYYPITCLQIVALIVGAVYFVYLVATGNLMKKTGKKHVKSSSRDILLQRKKK